MARFILQLKGLEDEKRLQGNVMISEDWAELWDMFYNNKKCKHMRIRKCQPPEPSICVVMLALWSPSSTAAHFAFCLTRCVVMLAFWSPSTAAHFAFCFLFVIMSGIGTQGEVG